MRELTENQKQAVEKFRHLKVGALFMACGTGKTQTASAIINTVDGVDALIWLCPCRTKENLSAELEKCGCRYAPRIVGIESLGQSDRVYEEELAYAKSVKENGGRIFVVCDESIMVKNLQAKRAQRALELSKCAEYKLILNGTPVTKNITDIYAQMCFLSPKILPYSYNEFLNRYCVYYRDWKAITRGTPVITGFANVEHLLSVIEPYTFTCELKLDVEKRYSVKEWSLNARESAEYEDLKTKMVATFSKESGEVELLPIFQKLQHFYATAEDKFRALEELVDDKTIVFCKFVDSAEAVRDRFPGTCVLTYGKGAIGLNLQQYSRIVYFDKTFDYAFREQSEGRIHRNGQTEDCEYIDLTGTPGLEGVIDACISKKQTLVGYFKAQGGKITAKDAEKVIKAL